jgi:PhzF family phenazine biosynthesis protein
VYDLIKNDKELFNKDITQINVKNDTLDVYNRIKENDSIYVPSPLPLCHKLSLDNEEIADALRIDKGMIDNGFGLALIDAGLNTLIVPLFDLDSCLKILPERTLLKSYCDKNEIDIVLSFTTGVSDRKNDYRTRVFTPGSGYLEVPAEGSGSAAFGYYLLKKGLWNGNLLTLEQNGSLKAPNIIRLITVGNQVIYGGSAKVKISGEYIIS